MSNLILTPENDPFWEQTLATLPPVKQCNSNGDPIAYAYVADPQTGLLRQVNVDEFREYALGGEYEERLTHMDDPYGT